MIFNMGSALDRRGMLRLIWINIEDRMIEKEIDQKTLSSISGIHPKIITKIKKRTANPTLKTLEKLAKSIGLTLGELCQENHRKE